MIISKTYIILVYLLRMTFFFNYSRPFIFWIMVELNLLLFIMIIYTFKGIRFKQEIFDLTIFYFLIQSIASILLLRDFFFSEDFFIFNSDLIFILSILIKLGIFPFFYWVFKISNFLNYFSLSLLLTFQKIPFFCILFSSFNSYIFFILFFSFFSGSILVVYRKRFIPLLVASSIRRRFWVFYLFGYRFNFFLFFYLIYRIFLFYIISCYNYTFKSSLKFWFRLIFFAFLLGLPPFRLFFFKFSIINSIFLNFGSLDSFLFWGLSFVSLFGYISYTFKRFFWISEPYNRLIKSGAEIFFYLIRIVFFFSFLL